MLRKQLTGHTNEKGRQIRIDTVGGKTIWLTNRVWDVPTNICWGTYHNINSQSLTTHLLRFPVGNLVSASATKCL